MFVIRGLNGEIMFDTELESAGKETVFTKYTEAKATLENLEKVLPKGKFKIIATRCERCGSENDVMITHNNTAFCLDCRTQNI